MQTIMDILNERNMEKLEAESELVKKYEVSACESHLHDAKKEKDDVCSEQDEISSSSNGAVTNTVHVQHAHSFQSNVVQTTVLPRASSEQSKLRILTRTHAVHSMSSTPSEESSEDLPQDVSESPALKHQSSSKDDCESGPSSLSSSRDSSFDYTDSTGTDLNDFIIKTLKNQRDKKMLLKLEKDFLTFISDPRKVYLQYPPMTSYHRMIVHRVAAYFGLDHNVDGTGKCIIVNKCPNTRFPEVRFSELVREDSVEDPALPKLILKRQNSLIDDSTPSERESPQLRRSLEGKKSKSIEEREEEYVKARARIFNHGSLSSQSSASSKDGDSNLPGLRDIDDENEKSRSDENLENDKIADVPQPAVKVLTNSSRSPETPKLMRDVSSNIDASSSSSSATLTTTVTDSKMDSSLQTRSSDASTVLAEGTPYLAGNIPPLNLTSRSKLVGTAGMIPHLSPNQTGGVLWTLPETQGSYPPTLGSVLPGHGTPGSQMMPEGYQATGVHGIQPGVGSAPTYFFPGQTGQSSQPYQTQPPRQPTPPQQPQSGFPSAGLPLNAGYGQQAGFQMYPTPRVYAQQDLDLLPQHSGGVVSHGSPHGMVAPNAGSPSSTYQELSGQLAGMSINTLEPQDAQGFSKRGSAYSPSCTQTFSAGQPVQYMVYRNISSNMVASQGQSTTGYLYSPANPQPLTQQPYTPQMYHQPIYPQQPFNQPYAMGDQTLAAHRTGTHTSPTPPPTASTMGTNSTFVHHVPTMPGTPPRQQFSTQVIRPSLAQVPARLTGPYSLQGQQLILSGNQQIFGYSQPYTAGQSKTTVQQLPRFKSYSEKGHSKPVDIYNPDPNHPRRPSPSDSPRANVSVGQGRRTSGGISSKSGHGKGDGQRSQHQQAKGKSKHKKNQHRHAADSSRKLSNPGWSVSEVEQTPESRVLEVYDVNPRDPDMVADELHQAGAEITWNDNNLQSAGRSGMTAKATFNSSFQAEQALRTNSNPNYKLRRCPAEIQVTETQNY